MPELTTQDVDDYTDGRLAHDADQTARLLATGLGLARRYCGWHVTPSRAGDVVTIDGPGSPLLVLPTLRLTELTTVVEEGVTADVAYIEWSPRGLLRKKVGYAGGEYGLGHCWTNRFAGLSVTMTHGFAEAPEWQSAVLSYVDRTSLAIGGVGQRETVGPFSFAEPQAVAGSAFTDTEKMLLDLYRLEPSA